MGKYISNAFAVTNGLLKKAIWKVKCPYIHSGGFLRVFKGADINFYRTADVYIGNGVKLDKNCTVVCVKQAKLVFGEKTGIGPGCRVICRKHIEIGDNTMFGPNVFLYDHDHRIDENNNVLRSEFTTDEIVIGKNCWIGANTIILKGTKIGDNCIIGAGCIIKGTINTGSKVIQKRTTTYL
ncbi:MAG: acyltransferase [Eubacterium sp.]|nr:acyltransferase [Eubacterium sp.]